MTRTAIWACAALIGWVIPIFDARADFPGLADSLVRVQAEVTAARYPAAEARARDLLREVERATGTDSAESAAVIDLVLESIWRGGNLAVGELDSLISRALRIRERSFGVDAIEVTRSLNNLANVSFRRGDWSRALEAYERINRIRELRLGGDHPLYAMGLYNLANLHVKLSHYEDAREIARRALAIEIAAEGAGASNVAMICDLLGSIELDTGEYAEAVVHLEMSLAAKERLFGRDHAKLAYTLGHLSLVEANTSNFVRAEELAARALAIRERALGPDHVETGGVHRMLATIRANAGQYAAASASAQRALAILEASVGPSHSDLIEPLVVLASSARMEGDLEGARSRIGTALVVAKATLDAENPQLAAVQLEEVRVLLEEGEPARAQTLAEEATRTLKAALGPSHPKTAHALLVQAEIQWVIGAHAAALELALEAHAAWREHYRLVAQGLSEEQVLRYAGGGVALDAAFTYSVSLDATREVWDAVIRSRGLVLEEVVTRQSGALRTEDPDVRRLVEQLATARRRLANVAVRGPGEGGLDAFRRMLADATSERDRAERSLAHSSLPFERDLTRRDVGLQTVCDSIPVGAGLVAFVRYQRWAPAKQGRDDTADEFYAAFILPARGAAPIRVELGPAEAIESAVRKWRRSLVDAGDEKACRLLGEAVRRRIWDPIAGRLAGTTRVYIVPDGVIHFVSFGALPGGRDRYCVETDPQVHYLTTERSLIGRGSSSSRGGLFVVAAPDFELRPNAALASGNPPSNIARRRNASPSCLDYVPIHFGLLPASAREGEEIADQWPGLDPVLVLHGADASEARVKAEASHHRILHLATHGFFLDGNCGQTPSSRRGIGILLEDSFEPGSDLEGRSGAEERPSASAVVLSPLLHSGVALAGANRRGEASPEEDDGILTAEEIAGLDLSDTEWVVVSACNTGLGEVQSGEGVLGLQRAFEVAGARTRILSLWSVDDEATRAWMSALYRARWALGVDTPTAMTHACVERLTRARREGASTHPGNWGAFVATGDWR